MNIYVYGVKKFILNSCFVKKFYFFFLENIAIIIYPFMENFIKKYES